MRKTLGSRKGFTLLELIIACSLASLVLLALVQLSASMVKFQMDSIRKGKVTGWSVIAATQINRELQDYNVLAFPNSTTTGGDWLLACKNWTRTENGAIDTTAGAAISLLYYCYDSTSPGYIRRYKKTDTVGGGGTANCPASPVGAGSAPACDGSGTWAENDIIASAVQKNGGANVFTWDANGTGVRIRYVIGNTAQSGFEQNPQNIPFDFHISLQKTYGLSSE